MFIEIAIIRDKLIKRSKIVKYRVSKHHTPTLNDLKDHLHFNFKDKDKYHTERALADSNIGINSSHFESDSDITYSDIINIELLLEDHSVIKIIYNTEEKEFIMSSKAKEIFDKYEDLIAEHLFKELNLVL